MLKPGMVVRGSWGGGWTTCIVKQVTEDEITLFRPYGHSADFTYTGGVVCYVGIDEFKISPADATSFSILDEGPVERANRGVGMPLIGSETS